VLGQYLCDGSRQCRLSMINVANGPDVHVRLAAIEFFFAHLFFSPRKSYFVCSPKYFLICLTR